MYITSSQVVLFKYVTSKSQALFPVALPSTVYGTGVCETVNDHA